MRLGKSKLLLTLIAALVLVAMALTGCGGGTDTSDEGSSGETVTLKIGIGAPLTAGATALGQGMERGANLAVKKANESQAVKDAGIVFETVSGDDQGDPKTGVNVANNFVSDKDLIGVMGHLNSGVTIPASKVYNEAKVVMVSPAATNPALTLQGFDNVFRVCTIDSVQGPVAAERAKALGFKTVVVIDDSTPYGEGLAAEFGKKFAADGGKVLFSEKTSDKDTDFNALVTKIKSQNPDLVYYGGIYNAGALLSKQMSDAGMTAPLMGGDGLYDGEFINLGGATQTEGDLCTSIGLPIDQLEKGQDFTEDFKAEYPDAEIAAYDAYSYDAADVIIQAVLTAIEEVGADKITTPEGREAIIAAVAAFDGEGISGAISFDENGDTTNKAVTLYKVTAGKWGAVPE